MCNVAGYVGEKNASTILIELIRRQEGLNGGFFTGMSTHDGARLHHAKVQGELKTLLNETDVVSFPGKMGIAHSRTPSGGDASWAHPFVTERSGTIKMAYIANGAAGVFAGMSKEAEDVANGLIEEGYDIPCKLNIPESRYTRISTGEMVHMSDIKCQLIYKYRDKGLSPVDSMTEAFKKLPSEIVGLMIEEGYSDRIFFSRINMPLFVGFDSSGAYLASTPAAFPESVKEYKLIPELSSGVLYKDRYETYPYGDFPKDVIPIADDSVDNAKDIILSSLKEQDCFVKELFNAVKKQFPEGTISQTNPIVYLALIDLLKTKKIEQYDSIREVDGQTAPLTMFRLA